MFLDAWFCLKDGQGDCSLCDGGALRLAGDDEPTGETCVLHHLVTEELHKCRRKMEKGNIYMTIVHAYTHVICICLDDVVIIIYPPCELSVQMYSIGTCKCDTTCTFNVHAHVTHKCYAQSSQ